MKKATASLLLSLFLLNACIAQDKVFSTARSIYKIDVIKPEDGIVGSGTAFCTKISKNKDDGWTVTLTTCAHILFLEEIKSAAPDMQTQFIVHKFYPVPRTFVANKFSKKKLGKDIGVIEFFSRTKPSDVPIKIANSLPREDQALAVYGCPTGSWPNVKVYNFLQKKDEWLFLMPSSKLGTSGSPVLNSDGHCVGVVCATDKNFTQCESLVKTLPTQ